MGRWTVFWMPWLLWSGSLSATSLGLIDQPQTFPWSVGLTPVVQEEAGGLDPGQYRVRSSVVWFNTYRQYGLGVDMQQRIDMEGLLETLSGAWSPAPGWELRGQVQGWALGGGVMDLFLSGFHGALAVGNQGRDLAPENSYRDYLLGAFDDQTPAAGLTQASFAVRGFSGPWSMTAWVKPPVPSHVGWGWSGRWGAGTGFGWGDTWPWADLGLVFRGGLSTAMVLVESEPSIPEGSGNVTVQAGGYAIAEWNSGWRALIEGTWTRVPRGGEGYLPQGAGLLTMGFQCPVDKRWSFEGALTEEFLTWATMEVGFQAGLVWAP